MDLEKQQQALAYKQQRATNSNSSDVDVDNYNDRPNGRSSNYYKYLTLAGGLLNNANSYGNTAVDVVTDRLHSAGATNQEIADILNQLGYNK